MSRGDSKAVLAVLIRKHSRARRYFGCRLDECPNRLRHCRQHARSALYPLAHLDPQRCFGGNDHVHPRAKLDESDTLAALQRLPFGGVENDATRQQPGNLLEGDLEALAAHGHNVLLVALRRSRVHGVQILAFLIAHTAQLPADRRAVHVYVKYAEEDADPLPRTLGSVDRGRLGDQAVSRRYNQALALGDRPVRIAEKPQEENRQQHRRNAPRPTAREPSQRHRHCHQTQTVDVTVTNHSPERLYGYPPPMQQTSCVTPDFVARTRGTQHHRPRRPGPALRNLGPDKSLKLLPGSGAQAQKSGLSRAA